MRRKPIRWMPSVVAVLLPTFWLIPPARGAIGDNSVGVNIHVGYPEFIAACADLGVGWVRVDGNWFTLEPAEGSYQWAAMDDGVNLARAAGLHVYLTLGYTPPWVSRHGDTDGDFGNDVPDNATAWSSFVQAAVQHFRPLGVTHYGMWNEPNLQGFFEGTVQEYADIILKPGAAAVRAVCNDCRVLGPDVASVGSFDTWMDSLFAAAPVSTFDIIAHHIYQGFPETGVQIWDNDRFFNVLDQQRFPFTRRSLRQVLDAAGYQGEVWITETGYRATPIGDTSEENLQATYVTLVLDEQLKRGWYTNTFFYEIGDCGVDQPGCTIDGFGLMRPTAGTVGARNFPADERLKPAFLALRQYIQDHPEITGHKPPPQCGDGIDNDGDGLTDLEDRGCTDAFDDNEADDPPRSRLVAYRTPGMVVDGDLSDVGPDGWISLGSESWRGTRPLKGPSDLAVRMAARWSVSGLYLALEVTDDVHDNNFPPDQLWQGDSIQLAFDPDQSGGKGYDAVDDQEINFALSGGVPQSFRYQGPAGASNDFQGMVVRAASVTRYEIHLAPSALPGATFAAGKLLGFSFLVNESDADGNGRVGWMEWTPGIGLSKVPAYFGEIELSDQVSGGPQQDGGSDAGQDGGLDAGGTDAGRDAGGDPGQHPDGALDADTAGDPGGDPGGTTSGGSCGCADGSGGGMLAAAVMLLLLSLVTRKRVRL